MIRELYTRNPSDPRYQKNILEHSNVIEMIISKVKMILGTTPGQIFGEFKFGLDIESLIFQSNINEFNLEKKIKEQINQYISEASDYKIDASVQFGKAEFYDYAIIDILINDTKVVGIMVS
ncbi:MAG: hypothetical protein RSE41_02910 [Clostridia bacterium]